MIFSLHAAKTPSRLSNKTVLESSVALPRDSNGWPKKHRFQYKAAELHARQHLNTNWPFPLQHLSMCFVKGRLAKALPTLLVPKSKVGKKKKKTVYCVVRLPKKHQQRVRAVPGVDDVETLRPQRFAFKVSRPSQPWVPSSLGIRSRFSSLCIPSHPPTVSPRSCQKTGW